MARCWGAALAMVVFFLAHAATWTVGPEDCDFADLREALEQARAGDIVEIRAGTYGGDVWIKRPTTLIGADRDHVIIEGNVFVLATSQVVLTGLNVQGQLVVEDSTGVVVTACRFRGLVARSSFLTVRSCEVVESPGHGILITLSSRALVVDTQVHGSQGDGVHVAAASLDLRTCTLRNNQGWGVWADSLSTIAGELSLEAFEGNARGALGGRAVVLDRVPPAAPANVQVHPNQWSPGPFQITWTNPPDLSGVVAAWYRWGEPPTDPHDGTRVLSSSSLVVHAPPEGQQKLYLWLEDRAGNIGAQWAEAITLCDRTPPEGQLVAPRYVTSPQFSVTVQAEDRAGAERGSGVASLRYSNDGKTWTGWEPFKTSFTWDLTVAGGSPNPGERTLFLQVQDKAGNVAEIQARVYLAQSFAQEDAVLSLAVGPEGLVALGLANGTIRLRNLTTGQELQVLKGHTAGVYGLAFSPDGTLLVSGALDNTVRLWEVRSGRELRVLRGHTGGVWTVAFAPDGKTVASGSTDGTVRLWNASDGKLVRTLNAPGGVVRAVAFTPDGKTLASGSDDKNVRLWDAQRGTLLRTLSGHSDRVRALAFSSDGKLLASGACGQADRGTCAQIELKIWEVPSGQEVATWALAGGGVRALAFAPDGNTLAIGTGDGMALLGAWKARQVLETLRGHTASVTGVAFMGSGTLLSVGEDGKLVLWRLAP